MRVKAKARLLLFALPIIALCAAAFALLKLDEQGRLPAGGLRKGLVPPLRTLAARTNDAKLRLRGPLRPTQPVVIVAIDSPSLDAYGRWPWHRDTLARLLSATLEAGARVVGLDLVLAEADPRTPPGLREELARRGLGALADRHETDPVLAELIARHRDRVVLGWQTESACQPGLEAFADCPVTDADYWASIPAAMARHGIRDVRFRKRLQAQRTPLMSLVTVLPNLEIFSAAAAHAGYYNAFPDPDGVVRSTFPVMLAAGRPHPSLPLAMAAIARGAPLELTVGEDQRLAALRFRGDVRPLPLSPLGQMKINVYGPGRTFPYVSARLLLDRDPEALRPLRGALVLVGLTALGVHDLRAFPFDSHVPGVEGHATILDNLLGGTALRPPGDPRETGIVLGAMTLGAALLLLVVQRLSARRGLLAFLAALGALGVLDMALLHRRVLLDTAFLYLELLALLILTLAVRYIEEERGRRLVRDTFSRYVSPAVVDSILQDPGRIVLGGERRELSILFSDLRGFTSISERLEAPLLVSFLNDYLGRMTDIVFAHGGTLDKYIGDAVMAFWGAPLPQADHAARALRAALDMVRAAKALRGVVEARLGFTLDLGIGVTTGGVHVGNMGSTRNVEYTVIGDRVNLASRLESLTKAYGAHILTTTETIAEIRRAGGEPPPHQLIDRVRVKGKREPVELCEVLDQPLGEEERGALAAAQALYAQGRFAEAGAAFVALGAGSPRRLYGLLAERCQRLSAAPPEGWDGTWEMESK